MDNPVYKLIEVTGTSPNGCDEAIKNAIARSSESIRNMKWFQVIENRGYIDGQKVVQWQVTLKVGFTLDKK